MTGTEGERPRVRILHHLARTGGVIISRCLGSMRDVVLLSEIHPKGTQKYNPLTQAHLWRDLFQTEEIRQLASRPMSFPAAIGLIEARATAGGRMLVIRDWSHLDFTGVPFIPTPPMTSALVESLAPHFELVRTATVRHPIDQWLSLTRFDEIQKVLDLTMFLHGCRAFAEMAVQIGFVRYEDFARAPDPALETLCERLALPFDPGYRERWFRYDRITGDPSRGSGEVRIALPPRHPMPESLETQFADNADYRAVLTLLGYGHPR